MKPNTQSSSGSLPAAALDYFLAPRASFDDATQILGRGRWRRRFGSKCASILRELGTRVCVACPGARSDAGLRAQLDASRDETCGGAGRLASDVSG